MFKERIVYLSVFHKICFSCCHGRETKKKFLSSHEEWNLKPALRCLIKFLASCNQWIYFQFCRWRDKQSHYLCWRIPDFFFLIVKLASIGRFHSNIFAFTKIKYEKFLALNGEFKSIQWIFIFQKVRNWHDSCDNVMNTLLSGTNSRGLSLGWDWFQVWVSNQRWWGLLVEKK